MARNLGTLKITPKSNIARVKCELNLSDEECIIFDMLMAKKSIQQISDHVGLSPRTVSRRISGIETQLNYLA